MGKRIAIAGTIIGTSVGITVGRTVRWWRTWGNDPREPAKSLPGDDLVPTPRVIVTRGITIDAPPAAVWPWLVQMGYGRAGWYSYDRLDMRGRSATTIVPGWQTLQVGDVPPFARRRVRGPAGRARPGARPVHGHRHRREPGGKDVRAQLRRPGRTRRLRTILGQTPQDFAASWAFVLEPLDGGRTRLIERFRIRVGAREPRSG